MVVKTFRGLLADGGQDRIRLQTIKGKMGYRIAKFELFPWKPGVGVHESTVVIWKTEQASVSLTAIQVDFTDVDTLGAGFFASSAASSQPPPALIVTFDREIFNQDIYVTYTNVEGSGGDFRMNYYLELELIPLDDAGAEYTTLKDMRQA